MNELDDAAVRALYQILWNKNPDNEHMGLLFQGEDGIRSTDTQSKNDASSVGGTWAIPKGSLRGIFHNHPRTQAPRGKLGTRIDMERNKFSQDDIDQARQRGVPSYIMGDEQKVMRFNPGPVQRGQSRTNEVLGQFPFDLLKEQIMKRMGRDPDDPRGMYYGQLQ